MTTSGEDVLDLIRQDDPREMPEPQGQVPSHQNLGAPRADGVVERCGVPSGVRFQRACAKAGIGELALHRALDLDLLREVLRPQLPLARVGGGRTPQRMKHRSDPAAHRREHDCTNKDPDDSHG